MSDIGNPSSYSITDYGADPSGYRDSRDAIMAAMVAARGAPGGYVLVPPGDYKVDTGTAISGSRSLFLDSGDQIIGYGEASRLFRPDTGSDRPVFSAALATGGILNNVLLSNFYVDCNVNNTAGASAAVWLAPAIGGDNLTIDKVIVRNTPDGMFAIWPTGFSHCTVRDCITENLKRDALHCDQLTDSSILNNRLTSGTSDDAGDDILVLGTCERVAVVGNVIENTSALAAGAAGRGIWLAACKDTVVAGNTIAENYRQNILIEGECNDLILAHNLIIEAGKRYSQTTEGDAIKIRSADGSNTIRRVDIADNIFITPRKHCIRVVLDAAASLVEHLIVHDNIAYVDRGAAWLDNEGRFFFADISTGGLQELELRGNRSDQMPNEGIYLKGAGIIHPQVVNERHYSCGRANPNQKAGYYFESLAQLDMRGCETRDRSGAAWTDYGARFINMNAGSGGVRARVVDCDFVDTVNSNVVWNPAGAPAAWLKDNNFGAAALP